MARKSKSNSNSGDMLKGISPLTIILILAVIAFFIFMIVKANKESYLLTEKDFYPIDQGYLFQQNIADKDQTQDYGCGC